MSDILPILIEWEQRLADMDNGEFDNGIMTSIRFEQRDKISKAINEIKDWRGAAQNWNCDTPKELEERIFNLPETY